MAIQHWIIRFIRFILVSSFRILLTIWNWYKSKNITSVFISPFCKPNGRRLNRKFLQSPKSTQHRVYLSFNYSRIVRTQYVIRRTRPRCDRTNGLRIEHAQAVVRTGLNENIVRRGWSFVNLSRRVFGQIHVLIDSFVSSACNTIFGFTRFRAQIISSSNSPERYMISWNIQLLYYTFDYKKKNEKSNLAWNFENGFRWWLTSDRRLILRFLLWRKQSVYFWFLDTRRWRFFFYQHGRSDR